VSSAAAREALVEAMKGKAPACQWAAYGLAICLARCGEWEALEPHLGGKVAVRVGIAYGLDSALRTDLFERSARLDPSKKVAAAAKRSIYL